MQNHVSTKSLSLIRSLYTLISLNFFFLSFCLTTPAQSAPIPVVVISQIVQHDSLDYEYKGLIAALKDAGYEDGKTIKIIYENAQGSVTLSGQIATHFASLKPTVAVAISTPSAQTLLKPMSDLTIPLVFTAVTDPIAAKLVTRLEPRSEPVTGVSDALLAGPQLDLVQKLVPSAKKIGIVYNAAETNSVKAVEELKEEAAKRGLTLVLVTADKASDVVLGATQLMTTVDALYIPTDNTAVAAMESIVALCKKYKVPVIAGDEGSVKKGAVAAQAYDRVTLGREAGALLVKILNGEKAGDLPVKTNHPLVLMINLKSARDMGVEIPEDIKSQAKIIDGDTP